MNEDERKRLWNAVRASNGTGTVQEFTSSGSYQEYELKCEAAEKKPMPYCTFSIREEYDSENRLLADLFGDLCSGIYKYANA